MEKLQFTTTIQAPKKKVWETMLDDETYREWTDVFNPGGGSYYEGEWKTGSNMRFLGPDKNGTISGMISRIKEARPYNFVSILHLGEIQSGKEILWKESQKAEENYTFKEKNGVTEVSVEIDTDDRFKKMFQDMWPKALKKLKELSEE